MYINLLYVLPLTQRTSKITHVSSECTVKAMYNVIQSMDNSECELWKKIEKTIYSLTCCLMGYVVIGLHGRKCCNYYSQPVCIRMRSESNATLLTNCLSGYSGYEIWSSQVAGQQKQWCTNNLLVDGIRVHWHTIWLKAVWCYLLAVL